LLEVIVDQWRDTHGSVDVVQLCQRLAENDVSWVTDEKRPTIERFLAWLDAELLALTEEAKPAELTPDFLQDLMHNSLAVLQAGKLERADERITNIRDILFARVRYVHSRARLASQRQRYYQLGLPLDDCKKIEDRQDELLNLFMQAERFETWDVDKRCEYLVKLADFLLTLGELKPNDDAVNGCWPQVLRLWLQGHNPNEIVQDPVVAAYTQSPAEVSFYIDDVFNYKLPWGLNALSVYLAKLAEEHGSSVPPIVAYLSALIKYGVHSPVASSLLAFGMTSRRLALHLSATYPGPLRDVSDVLIWFLGLTVDDLARSGLDGKQIEAVRSGQTQASRLQTVGTPYSRQQSTFEVTVHRSDALSAIQPGDLLIIRSTPEGPPDAFSLHTLWGGTVGTFQLERPLPATWRLPEKVEMHVEKLELLEGDRLRFQVVAREV